MLRETICVPSSLTLSLKITLTFFMRLKLTHLVLVGLVVLAREVPAEAYLDPGAGSILLQVLLGGVAAVGIVAKLFWHQLSAPFRRRQPGSDQ